MQQCYFYDIIIIKSALNVNFVNRMENGTLFWNFIRNIENQFMEEEIFPFAQ